MIDTHHPQCVTHVSERVSPLSPVHTPCGRGDLLARVLLRGFPLPQGEGQGEGMRRPKRALVPSSSDRCARAGDGRRRRASRARPGRDTLPVSRPICTAVPLSDTRELSRDPVTARWSRRTCSRRSDRCCCHSFRSDSRSLPASPALFPNRYRNRWCTAVRWGLSRRRSPE